MADLSGMQDPTNGETQKPFEPGDYTLSLVKSEMVESKKNAGNWYLACEFEIEESPRRVWANFNLINSNATAQEIAWWDWNSVCHACGKLGVQDSSEIHGIPFKARVGFEKGDPEKLKFSGPKPLNSAPSATRQSGGGTTPQAGGGGNKPWLNQGNAA